MELAEREKLRKEIEQLQVETADWTTEDTFRWAFSRLNRDAAVVSGFGAEGMVVIHLAARIQPGFRLITLDTDFLFPETYRLMKQVERRYNLQIERVQPLLTPEEQERQHGAALWAHDPDLCCRLRKVEPLKRQLAGLKAWITGIRRDQSPTRAGVQKLEWDSKFGLVKLNPLADWTWAEVWQFIHRHKVPYNPLHDRNYPSIGCTHCTRAVLPEEDQRAGRWADFTKTECGLHMPQSAETVQSSE